MTAMESGPILPGPEYCSYAGSRLRFRGPALAGDPPRYAVLGSGLSFGRFVADPWPALLGAGDGQGVLNLASPQTGPEAWLSDPALTGLANRAALRLVEVPGMTGISNRYYQVHPRRNDRLLRCHPALSALFPQTDFADFSFTGHLTSHLAALCPQRFALVAADLQRAWGQVMSRLLLQLVPPVVLVWLHYPGEGSQTLPVSPAMLQALRPGPVALTEVPALGFADQDGGPLVAGQERVARLFPSQDVHQALADELRHSLGVFLAG